MPEARWTQKASPSRLYHPSKTSFINIFVSSKQTATQKQNELATLKREKVKTMTNSFVAKFNARIEVAKAKNSTQSNIDKLQKMRDAFNNQAMTELFEASQIDAERFMRAIYASEKVVRFAAQAVNHAYSKNNQMMYVVFRTAINCYRNNESMLLSDAEAACLNTLVSDERKHLIYSRKSLVAESTKNAQSQTSVDALITLNILTKDNEKINAFKVNFNAIAQALCEKLDIDTSMIEAA